MRPPVVLAFLLLGCAHPASAAPPVDAPSNLPASLPRLGATSARGAELFVDVAGGRLFTVTPSGQLAAFALSSGRELWAKEAPSLAWPLLVEPRGRLLSAEVAGSGATLVRRDVATGTAGKGRRLSQPKRRSDVLVRLMRPGHVAPATALRHR